MGKVVIKASVNGSYIVEGEVDVIDAKGNVRSFKDQSPHRQFFSLVLQVSAREEPFCNHKVLF